jgi:adenine-specific DNA glycosylase
MSYSKNEEKIIKGYVPFMKKKPLVLALAQANKFIIASAAGLGVMFLSS